MPLVKFPLSFRQPIVRQPMPPVHFLHCLFLSLVRLDEGLMHSIESSMDLGFKQWHTIERRGRARQIHNLTHHGKSQAETGERISSLTTDNFDAKIRVGHGRILAPVLLICRL